MSRLNVWPWLRPFIILVLVVTLPPLLYWFGYVQHSVQAAKQQAYITLSAVATNFRDRLAAHDQIASTAERMAARQPERLKGYLESVLQPKSTLSVAAASTHLEINRINGGLYLNVGRIPNVARPRGEAIRCGAAPECSIRAVMPLENLVPWNVVQTEFDGLLVLSHDKYLLAQDRRLPTQPLGVAVPLKGPASVVAAQENADKKSASAASLDRSLRLPVDFSDQSSIELAGIEYIVFTQQVPVVTTPVGLSTSEDAVSKQATLQFTVCGLVAKDRLRRESLELSPQTLIMIAALVALGLFSIPFLKLRFIGARERMHPRDIWLLATSLLCATALMVMVILDAHTLVNLRERFDAGLFQFSRSVQSQLRAETRSAVEQLRTAAPELLSAPAGADAAVQAPECEFQTDGTAAIAPLAAEGAVLASARTFVYPDFEAAFATDLCGFQARKWMPRTIPTPSISVRHESYFPEAMALGGRAASPFVHSSVIAPTSGLPLGIYAMPLDAKTLRMGPEVAAADRSGIIVLATPMRSVNFPVVPEPFQFVLVNRQGEVTFQQAQGPFRGERFFDSVAGGAALERLARTPGSSDMPTAGSYQYRGRTYRMNAVDMPDLQLTLVAYYDQSAIGLVTARVFSTTAMFVLGIIVSILAGTALAVCWFGKGALDWAWPTPSRTVLYFMGSAVCVLAMLALLLARSIFSSYWLIWFMLAAPAVVMLVLGSGRVVLWLQWLADKLKLNAEPSRQRSPRLTSLAFQSFAVMAMLALVAWPTSIVFNDAFTLHAAAYASSVERNWNIAKTKWLGRLQGSVTNMGEPLPAQNCDEQPDLRCILPDRIYAASANYEALVRTRNDRGIYDDCANLRSADGGCKTDLVADAVPASFTVGTAYRLSRLGRPNTELGQTLAAYRREQQQSRRAPLLEGFGWTRWNVGGFALLIGAMALLVGSISKHVLGVGLTNDLVLDEHDQFERKDGTRWLFLRPSSTVLADIGGPNVTQLDLRDLQLVPQLAQPPAGAVLCVQHLERRLSDQQWRDALLALLNTDTPGCLVFTSEIDPLYYLTQRSREKEDYLRSLGHEDSPRRKEAEEESRELRNELAHWGVALREMRKIRQMPAPFPDIPVTAERVELREKLVRECAGMDPPLIEIGARLLRRPDLTSYRWDEIVGFMLDAAEPYYRAMWELCSREERLVLIQLAQEGLVNPRRVELVRRLARRGLVRFDPRLRLMNESFQRFVRTVEAPDRIAEWERTAEGMSWSRLGTPLYALAAVVIAILLFTEQAMFTSVLAIATGAAGTLGSLRSLYAAARPSNSTAKVV